MRFSVCKQDTVTSQRLTMQTSPLKLKTTIQAITWGRDAATNEALVISVVFSCCYFYTAVDVILKDFLLWESSVVMVSSTNKIKSMSAKLSPVVSFGAAPNKVIIQSDLIELPVVRNIWGEVKWGEISSDQQYPRQLSDWGYPPGGLNGINGGLEDSIVDRVGYEGRELPQSDYTSWLLNNCILMSLSSPQIWSII